MSNSDGPVIFTAIPAGFEPFIGDRGSRSASTSRFYLTQERKELLKRIALITAGLVVVILVIVGIVKLAHSSSQPDELAIPSSNLKLQVSLPTEMLQEDHDHDWMPSPAHQNEGDIYPWGNYKRPEHVVQHERQHHDGVSALDRKRHHYHAPPSRKSHNDEHGDAPRLTLHDKDDITEQDGKGPKLFRKDLKSFRDETNSNSYREKSKQ